MSKLKPCHGYPNYKSSHCTVSCRLFASCQQARHIRLTGEKTADEVMRERAKSQSIRLVNYDCNITEIPPGEYKAHVEGVWGPSEVEQIGTVHIAVDAGYANYRDIFKEEKKVKKINTVRVVGVTFNANTHNGNDTRMFRYLCPYEVKAGDIVIADTCYGPSLAKVAQVECYDATMSCRYNGLKTVIHAPLNIEMMKCASACAAQDMIKKCENDSCYKKLNDLQIRREGILHAKDEVLEDLHKANTEIAALESYMRRAGLL